MIWEVIVWIGPIAGSRAALDVLHFGDAAGVERRHLALIGLEAHRGLPGTRPYGEVIAVRRDILVRRDLGGREQLLHALLRIADGDPVRLEQVVGNLLDNAARHAKSRIAIGLRSHDDHVILRVDDDGPGVAEEERVRIFERFVRLDEARDRGSGGPGLGLAIVAEVAAGHGGSARAIDSPLGGARLEIRLPAASD